MTKGELLNTFIQQMMMMWDEHEQEKRARPEDASDMMSTIIILGRALTYEKTKERLEKRDK